MLTIVQFSIPGQDKKVDLAAMSFKGARQFVTEGLALAKKEDTPPEVWLDRTAQTVADSFNRAGNIKPGLFWTGEKVQEEFAQPTIKAMYDVIFEISGLRTAEPGEASAAPTSANSAAA